MLLLDHAKVLQHLRPIRCVPIKFDEIDTSFEASEELVLVKFQVILVRKTDEVRVNPSIQAGLETPWIDGLGEYVMAIGDLFTFLLIYPASKRFVPEFE